MPNNNTLFKTPSERLLSLLLLNENVQDSYMVTKTLEDTTTVIQIIHRIEGKRKEEHVASLVHGQ